METTQVAIVGIIVLAVLAFVAWPMLARRRSHAGALDVDRIEARIDEYRAALRRDTVCQDCLFANVEGARFCAECGSRLPAARATASV